jgi:predicted Zn-dependent protease
MGLLGGGGDGISVVPVGDPDEWLVREARHAVETRYGLETGVADPVSPPEESYDPDREQYDAEGLLEAVGREGPRSGDWLAVTERDLYYNRNNYVFGTAYVGGEGAVASIYRLGADDRELTRRRWHKQVLKQVGHALGAGRCDDKHCLFNFTPTVRELDVQSDTPCGTCRRELDAEGVTVETDPIGEAPAHLGSDGSTGGRGTTEVSTNDDTPGSDGQFGGERGGDHVTAPTEADIERPRSGEPEETDSRSQSVDDVVSGLRLQALAVTFLLMTGAVLLLEAFLYDWLWGFDGIPTTHFWGLLAVAALTGLSLTRRARAAAGRAVAYVRS